MDGNTDANNKKNLVEVIPFFDWHTSTVFQTQELPQKSVRKALINLLAFKI